MKNKKYIIIADSTTDLPHNLIDDIHLKILPLGYTINGENYKNYLDFSEQDIDEFYSLLKDGHQATTTQLNPDDYIQAMEPYLKDGYDILLLTLSSELSGTYNSARLATLELKEKYNNNEIILIDSKSASLGFGYIVNELVSKKKDGKTIDELSNYANDLIKRVAHWFTVDDINHLRRGGRISAVSSFVARTLRIKPILHCSKEGKLIPRHKALSRKRSIKALFDQMEKTSLDNINKVFIGHGDDIEAANSLKDMILEKYPNVDVLINHIGPVIGAHTGRGVLAIFYEASER